MHKTDIENLTIEQCEEFIWLAGKKRMELITSKHKSIEDKFLELLNSGLTLKASGESTRYRIGDEDVFVFFAQDKECFVSQARVWSAFNQLLEGDDDRTMSFLNEMVEKYLGRQLYTINIII